MDANNFFANASNRPLGVFQRNEFGGSVGGPVVIPWLYKGQNKTFFFTAFEGRRQRSAVNTSTVCQPHCRGQVTFHRPSMRRDNCESSTILFRLHPIPRALANLSAPRSRVTESQPIVWIRWLWKLKSSTDQPRTFPACRLPGQSNYLMQGKFRANVNRGTAKVDHNIDDHQRLFVRYSVFDNQNAQPVAWDSRDARTARASQMRRCRTMQPSTTRTF
jgi:hypothetical protein